MKIAIGSDHAGYVLKEIIKQHLEKIKIDYIDFGTNSTTSVDYPDYAKPVSFAVAKNEVDFGILVCFTGIGMSISSNKVKGIRAALVLNVNSAKLTREHNNANVLCLSAKDLTNEQAIEIVDTFLKTSFLGDRHLRRINKIMEIEDEQDK